MTIPLVPSIDYTSRDYAAIRADMIRLIRARIPLWSGDNPNDFGLALVEAYAYSVDILDYYLDRIGNEAYLSTAVQRESLYSIAAMFNYTPRTATVAGVELFFSNTTATEVVLPQGTRCRATVGDAMATAIKDFETLSEVVVPARSVSGPGEISVLAVEGRTYLDETLGVSNGFVRQQFLLPRTSVVRNSITITTSLKDGQATTDWYEIDDLSQATPGMQVFQALRQTDGSTVVRFGDGQFGSIPPIWSVIRATYRVGGGADGNVEAMSIDTIVEPAVYGVSVRNLTAAGGGQDEESIDSIRINAARAFRARDRAVTIPDYEAVALSSPLVSKAKAVGNNGSSVTLYIVPDDDGSGAPEPSRDVLTGVINYVGDRSMAGVTIQAFGPLWVPIYITLAIRCLSTAVVSVVDQQVSAVLNTYYGFPMVDFNGRVAASDIVKALSSVPGIDYVEVVNISLLAPQEDPANDPPPSTSTIHLAAQATSAIQFFRADEHLTVSYSGGLGNPS